jgi:hypothetical protein
MFSSSKVRSISKAIPDKILACGTPWAQQPFNSANSLAELGPWTLENTVGAFPLTSMVYSAMTKNRVYFSGSWLGNHAVVYLGIDASGNIIPTLQTGNPATESFIPSPWPNFFGGGVFVTPSQVVAIHGTMSGSDAIWTNPINASGVLTGAVSNGNTGLAYYGDFGLGCVKDKFAYLFGGWNQYTGTWSTGVYRSPISVGGSLGAWSLVGNLPIATRMMQVVTTPTRVYLMGGIQVSGGSPNTVTSVSAPYDASGNLGSWTAGPSLPNVNCGLIALTKTRAYFADGAFYYNATIDASGVMSNLVKGSAQTIGGYTVVTSSKIYQVSIGDGKIYSCPFSGGANSYR